MSKEMAVIALGLWIIILPYLGVPSSWRTTFIVVSGIAIVITGFWLRVESLSRGGRRSEHHPFVEHMPTEHIDAHDSPAVHHAHDRKEGITSLN